MEENLTICDLLKEEVFTKIYVLISVRRFHFGFQYTCYLLVSSMNWCFNCWFSIG